MSVLYAAFWLTHIQQTQSVSVLRRLHCVLHTSSGNSSLTRDMISDVFPTFAVGTNKVLICQSFLLPEKSNVMCYVNKERYSVKPNTPGAKRRPNNM